jgi:hypothetical protein
VATTRGLRTQDSRVSGTPPKKGFLPQAKKKYVRHNHEEQHAQKKFNHE